MLLFVFIFWFGKANTSNLQPIGARSAALSHATIAADGILSAFQNQAALATLENFSAGFAIENRFLVPELNIDVNLIWPFYGYLCPNLFG